VVVKQRLNPDRIGREILCNLRDREPQIEERLKDTKTGQALRHLPSGDINANRVWLTASLLALNLTAWCCDLCPAAAASGQAAAPAPPTAEAPRTYPLESQK